ncbi:hypothetical protein SHIRM173S_05705 [Streptomyces hirsutus]
MNFDSDFLPDESGLIHAVHRLLHELRNPGVLHASPDTTADLPDELPRDGIGGHAALDALSATALRRPAASTTRALRTHGPSHAVAPGQP